MKPAQRKQAYRDVFSQPTAYKFSGKWNSIAVAQIIRVNSSSGKSPAFLYLGREEIELLRAHLGAAFGEESVCTLHETYYMGLKVVPVAIDRYIRTGGSKVSISVQAPKLLLAS